MITGTSNTLKYLLFLICLVFSTALTACSQTHASSDLNQPAIPSQSASPVAYIYVERLPVSSGPYQMLGYTVAANGKLALIKGFPFDIINVGPMAVNGKYMFVGTASPGVDTYAIEPNGTLRFVVSNSFPEFNGGGWGAFFLSHDGATLYGQLCYGDEDEFASFSIDKATGTLALTQTDYPERYENAFTLSANDKFVYVASAWVDGPDVSTLNTQTWAESRDSIPAAPTGYFNPELLSADPLNHVAALFANSCYWCADDTGFIPVMQLGVYTADVKGNLTINGTNKDWPTLDQTWGSMRMSPSGKLLALGGTEGLKVFHFNGGEPITLFATLLKNVTVADLHWDTDNHLYAFDYTQGKIYVLTITPTSIEEAPGSPYSIPGAVGLIVQPLPL